MIVVIKSVCVLNICKQIFSSVYTCYCQCDLKQEVQAVLPCYIWLYKQWCCNSFRDSSVMVLGIMHVMVCVDVTSIQTHVTAEEILSESSSATPWLNKTYWKNEIKVKKKNIYMLVPKRTVNPQIITICHYLLIFTI